MWQGADGFRLPNDAKNHGLEIVAWHSIDLPGTHVLSNAIIISLSLHEHESKLYLSQPRPARVLPNSRPVGLQPITNWLVFCFFYFSIYWE